MAERQPNEFYWPEDPSFRDRLKKLGKPLVWAYSKLRKNNPETPAESEQSDVDDWGFAAWSDDVDPSANGRPQFEVDK